MPAPKRRARLPTVEIQVQSLLWNKAPRAQQTVREAIAAAAALLSTAGGEVSIVLTGDSDMKRLNKKWRGIDRPTNVLSFPAAKAGDTGMLGDIVIAYETVRRECDDEGKDFLHHLAHLAAHGFLHLLGHDHATDRQAEAMEALESKIMARMKLPDPYLVRDLG